MQYQKQIKTLPGFIVNLFFIIGIIYAICFRIIIVFRYVATDLFRIIWYIGIIGYFSFFLYRYLIALRRRRIIVRHQLIPKLKGRKIESAEDYQALLYITESIMKSREMINYYIIFILSICAIVIDIVLSIAF